MERTGNEWGGGVGANWECIGRRGLERTGNVLGGGGCSELGINWEAGVGARGNKLGGGVGANWE